MSSQQQPIDIQKLHLAPKPVQLIAAVILAVVLVGVGYLVMFKEQMETLDTAKATEMDELRPKYEKIATQVANLENLEAELKLIEQSISSLIKQLPTDSELPNLVQELHQAAATNGLTMTQVVPRPKVKEDDNIERLPFRISLSGSYEQLANFVRDVGRMSRIVTLSSINVIATEEEKNSGNNKKAASKAQTKFTLTAIASTYKAVDTEKPAASAASGAASAAQK